MRLRCPRLSSRRVSSYPEALRVPGRSPPHRRNPWIPLACRPAPRPCNRRRAGFLDRCLGSRNPRPLTPGDRSRNPRSPVRVNGSIDRRQPRREGHSRSRSFPRSAGWRYPFPNAPTRCRLLRSGYRPSGVWNCRLRPARSMDRKCLFRRPGLRSRCLVRRPHPFRCLLPRRRRHCPYRCHCPRPRRHR